MGFSWEETEAAALNRQELRQCVAQYTHMDAAESRSRSMPVQFNCLR